MKNGKSKLDKIIKKESKKHQEKVLLNRKNIINNTNDFATMEAYRTTRTNIMFSLPDEKDCKKILITSAMQGDGKSTTSINLALSFARTGAKVLLIDADLRLPMVHAYLDLPNNDGLSNVLAGLSKLDDVVVKQSGVDIITSGHTPQNPTELLSSNTMVDVIDKLSYHYDYIFIDTPPIGILVDAVVISKLMSGVIMVVRQNRTVYKAISEAITSLEFANANFLGFIINDSSSNKFHYSYRSKKSGYYHYQYSYYNNLNQSKI